MSQYYLMAQLPSLDGVSDGAPLPITEERFGELCHRFLGKKSLAVLQELTLLPPRDGVPVGSPLVDGWNAGERQLRLALSVERGNKLKKTVDIGVQTLPAQLLQTARIAVETDDPLAAERFLNRHRLSFLESLRPLDAFSEDAVFYYALKLKLLLRLRQFDAGRGEAAYRNIYNSILDGEGQEAI